MTFYTYKVNNDSELLNAIEDLKTNTSDDILIQEFIVWDEYSVPLVNWKVLPIIKLEKNKEDFFDYSSKYEDNSKMKEIFPNIQENLKNKLISDSKIIYDFFNLKWISRIDFLVKNDKLYFLEVNTIPGLTDASILPQAWRLTWKTNEELVESIKSPTTEGLI